MAAAMRLDLSRPLFAALALFLCALIGLPLFWLFATTFTDRQGTITLANFTTILGDPVFLDPFGTTIAIACSVGVAAALVAAPISWLVARSDMPFARTVRALIMASFVTPPFLGAIAWEILAAPNSGILNRVWWDWSGAEDPLFNLYSGPGLGFVIACYTFPYVFVLVANALDRIPAELEDSSAILGGRAFDTARRITIPFVLPAIMAGALVAFLQAMTLFG